MFTSVVWGSTGGFACARNPTTAPAATTHINRTSKPTRFIIIHASFTTNVEWSFDALVMALAVEAVRGYQVIR
jgi:hypothetical protein